MRRGSLASHAGSGAKAGATSAAHTGFDLREADARSLPFAEETFDVIYNSYMLDLISLEDMPNVVDEF